MNWWVNLNDKVLVNKKTGARIHYSEAEFSDGFSYSFYYNDVFFLELMEDEQINHPLDNEKFKAKVFDLIYA
jgi:hypothetical protein